MNSFGNRLRLTTFGESHGAAIGGVIDGFPSNIKLDFDEIQAFVDERRPGSPGTTKRREEDKPEFLSGISPEGITLGTPIGFIIRNKDTRSGDYFLLSEAFRPNHADFTYEAKYGIRDHRGGGRASARETACRVVGGALALQYLKLHGIKISAFLCRVGNVATEDLTELFSKYPERAEQYRLSEDLKERMMQEVENVRMEGDSVGGAVMCVVSGLPTGLGEPIYDKLSARLAQAMMGINAAKGFEIGRGFALASSRGSLTLDNFKVKEDGGVSTSTNYSGGVQGGISNGMPVFFRTAFKPTPTIGREVGLLTKNGGIVTEVVKGRHDPCVAVRAVPVVKAMTALTVADFLLSQ